MVDDVGDGGGPGGSRYDAVLFDLLTALLDSWTLWDGVAGDPATGRRWRGRYVQLTYAAGDCAPYELLVAQAARAEGLDDSLAHQLALARLGVAPHRVLFVAGSRFDLPGAAGAGMPVWWHDRIHAARGELSGPLAEHDTLTPLPGYVVPGWTAVLVPA